MAALAGIPKAVIQRARRTLQQLEEHSLTGGGHPDLFAAPAQSKPEEHPALEALREIDPDALTPREALELVYRLTALARG